jgi:hypothetical protein
VEFANDGKHVLVASTDRHCRYIALEKGEGKITKHKKKNGKTEK